MDMLPRKALNTLKTRLSQIEQEIKDLNAFYRSTTTKSGSAGQRTELEARVKRKRRLLELAIREAFLRFMASIMQNYKAFQRTVTRRPDVKAIDRNLAKFFDCEAFVRSKDAQCHRFYAELTRTQLFYDCIMNLSFTSELEPALADAFYFFAEVCSKLAASPTSPSSNTSGGPIGGDELRLLELNECENSQTVVVLPPTSSSSNSTSTNDQNDDVSTSNPIVIEQITF